MKQNWETLQVEVEPSDLPPLTMFPDDALILWCAVLERAIEDLHPMYQATTKSSCDWFISNLYAQGSFVWICHHISNKSTQFKVKDIRKKYEDLIYWQYT